MSSTGQQLVDLVATRVGEAYRLGIRVDLDDPDYHGRPHGSPAPPDATRDRAWDCAELATWGVRHAHGVLLGVLPGARDPYTGHWAGDVDAGRVETVPIAEGLLTAGALLLRRPAAEGASGHIAVSDGRGGTVEAHSTSRGVVRERATGRRWDHAILIPGVAYTRTQGVALPLPAVTVLRPGSTGPAVVALQRRLAALGYDPGPADGVYGRRTVGAVTRYQADRGLVPDGEAGPQTLGALARDG